MELYEMYYKDIFLGILKVDTVADKYEFIPDKESVQQVKNETWLIREIVEGTKGFVPPIPFFQERIRLMKRRDLKELRYHTDYFVIIRRDDERQCE